MTVEEHYPGSPIVLLPDRIAMETKQQAEIVAAGPGDYDEDGDWVPTDPRLQPDAWIVYREFMRVPGPDDLFFLHEDDVVAILEMP